MGMTKSPRQCKIWRKRADWEFEIRLFGWNWNFFVESIVDKGKS